jgi:hypothetical protein
LLDGTVKGACWFTAGQAAGAVVSAKAASAAQGVLHAMYIAKIKLVAAAVVAAGLVAGGAGVLAYRTLDHSATSATQAIALPEYVDPGRWARAPVVLRVQRRGPTTMADKQRWERVEILHVYKNTTGHSFAEALMVASSEEKQGLPAARCTIYLERLNPADPNDHHWKLLGGGALEGISHVAPSADKHKSEH